MFRSALLIAVTVFAFACSKEKTKDQDTSPAPPPVTDTTAAAGSGSAQDSGSAAAAGSADAGSADAGSAAAGSGADAGSGAAEPVAKTGFDFDKLTHDEKVKFMKTKVMPTMKPLFQKFDKKEFGNFTCKTCHGKDPAKAKYEMPTKDLPALDFDAIKAGKEDPKMVEFMAKVVKPEMAKLLNEPEMTESEPKGFGCLHCHTTKK